MNGSVAFDRVPATQLVFVYSRHHLPGIFEAQSVQYFEASSEHLQHYIAEELKRNLELFSESHDYGDYFSLAEFDDPAASLSPTELNVLQSALSLGEGSPPFEDLPPLDVLGGYRAVMISRASREDLESLRSAAELYNELIERGLSKAQDDRRARSFVRVETAQTFGPWFVHSLLSSTESVVTSRSTYADKVIKEAFTPIKPLLEMLRTSAQRPGWPWTDIHLGRLLLIVDYFNEVLDSEIGI